MTGNTDPGSGTIVVGVDGTAASAAAVRWAVQEARLRRASVHLVCADDPGRRGRAPYSARPVAPRPDEGNAARTALHDAEEHASQALPPGRLSSELADGSPAQVLINRSAGADLLVLGRAYPAEQPASQAPPAMGPVARACLHGAACPVVFADPAPENLVSTANTHRHLMYVPRGRPLAESRTDVSRALRLGALERAVERGVQIPRLRLDDHSFLGLLKQRADLNALPVDRNKEKTGRAGLEELTNLL